MARKGFFTPNQEKMLDDLYEGKGIVEALDGMAIRLVDNQGLERLKKQIPEDVLPVIYEVIDEICAAITPPGE